MDTAAIAVKVMTYIFLFLMVLTAFIYSFTTIKSKIEILRGIYKLSVCSGLAVEKLKSHAGIHKVRFFINEVSENSTIPFNPKKKLDDFLIRKYKENGIQELKDGVFMIHSTTLDFYRKVPINKPINLIIYEPLGLLIFFELLE